MDDVTNDARDSGLQGHGVRGEDRFPRKRCRVAAQEERWLSLKPSSAYAATRIRAM